MGNIGQQGCLQVHQSIKAPTRCCAVHLPHIYSKEMTGKSTIVSHILCILYYQFT